MAINTTGQKAQPRAVALFISDLHLHSTRPQTTQAFTRFLAEHASRAKQLYLLGDIFEYWAGDDDLSTSFHQNVIAALMQLRKMNVELFWMAGNRDFLAGQALMDAINATKLPDPYVANIAGLAVALSHGDEQCTDDTKYMEFRKQVRNPVWQEQFLKLPLEQRKTIIENARKESQAEQRGKSSEIMDVNSAAIADLFKKTGTTILVHGHTHRPAHHFAQEGKTVFRRIVLPDWEYDNDVQRGGWAGIFEDGSLRRFGVDGEELEVIAL